MADSTSLDPFSPGCYACIVNRTIRATHAMQLVKEGSTAVFVLEIAGDKSVTSWRGWRYLMHNDGPKVHTSDRIDEQQGYRGQYQVNEGAIEVNLVADDTICAPHNERHYQREPSLHIYLRCQWLKPRKNPQLTIPSLVCEWQLPESTSEVEYYLARGLFKEPRMVLGFGNGYIIEILYRSINPSHDPMVKVELANTKPKPDTWEKY